jgi:TonB-dependent starch-binding outer membrane protein SusC
LYEVGHPLNIRKVYTFAGIDESTGLYSVDDINKDGIINFEDRNEIKFLGRDFFGGLQNSISYKGFQFDVLIQFVKQYGSDASVLFGAPGQLTNQMASISNEPDVDRQQRLGQSAQVSTAYLQYTQSNKVVTDASFIRLKNISLSYTLPQRFTKEINIVHSKLFLQGQNLLTLTKYKGLDPEAQSGIQLPPLRVVTMGIQLTF